MADSIALCFGSKGRFTRKGEDGLAQCPACGHFVPLYTPDLIDNHPLDLTQCLIEGCFLPCVKVDEGWGGWCENHADPSHGCVHQWSFVGRHRDSSSNIILERYFCSICKGMDEVLEHRPPVEVGGRVFWM